MTRPWDVSAILIGGLSVLLVGSIVLCAVLFVVGETVEHFTP